MSEETSAPPLAQGSSSCAVTWDETDRLSALQQYGILDTGREAAFDDMAELAADILDAPIAVVNFIAADRQWFKAEKGIGQDSLPLDVSICRWAILQPGVFVVPDLSQDERFQHNPLVDVAGGLRFYAGALLATPDGLPLGTVCVLDTKPRPDGITPRQERALKALAAQAMAQLELRRSDATARIENQRLAAMFAQATVGMCELDLDGRFLTVNDRLCDMLCRPREELLTLAFADVTHPDDLAVNVPMFARMATTGQAFSLEKRYVRPDGTVMWANSSMTRLLDEAGMPRAAMAVTTDITARREEERHRTFLLDLGDRTRRLNDPQAVIAATTRALGEEIGATRVVYADIDELRDRATVQSGWTDGSTAHLPEVISLRDFGKDLIGRLRSGGTLRVEDSWENPHTQASAAMLDAISVRAIVSVPLFKDGRFVVNLNVHQDVPRTWTDAEIALIEAVAERTWESVERARAETALREMNETLERRVLDTAADLDRAWRNASDIFVVVDGDGLFRRVNPAGSVILGWTEDEMLGRPMFEFLHPDDRKPTAAALTLARDGKSVGPFENRYRAKDGRFLTMSWVGTTEGTMTYGYGRDVTSENRVRAALDAAEAARQEADALYRAYFEHTPEALFVIRVEENSGFFVEEINPTHEATIGLKIDDIRGRRIEEILPPDVADRVLVPYRHVVETGAIHQYREVFDFGNDPQHWDTSLVPVRDADGRITRLIGSSRNVTRQVVAEEALRQSQKMEAMGQLTGGVAHDFNNLLTPIVGGLDMLQRKKLGGEREQRLIVGAMQSAERAKTLVQRLLAFARRQPLQSVPVDVAKLVTGMGDLISSTTGPQIKVIVEAPGDLPSAKADPNQLEMALLNLAVNARDAMPDGGSLRISAGEAKVGADHPSKLGPGSYIRLSVADTGAGMDEATLARAVEPFFSTKGIGKGTGLGLSMVHGLASQLGGALTINSRPGLGTNVELWLPRSVDAAESAEPAPDPSLDIAALGTALLVDDEDLVRLSTADMLTDLGYSVIEAASGEEALRLVNKGAHVDLLVTDHLMPGVTGTDLAAAVRSTKPGMPVLLVSGYAEPDGVQPGLPRLTKPFRKDELAASLAELLTP